MPVASPGTFLLAIVVALGVGAAVALLWQRSRAAAIRAAAERAQPVEETLRRIESRIGEIEAARAHDMGGLEQQLTSLSRETVALSHALRSPGSRGRWGELTLRRLAELAGLVSQCDFFEQETIQGATEAARRKPDMIVRLAGGRTLAVDAKVPLNAYLEAEAASDDGARRAALDRHAAQLWRHVTALSSREYWAELRPAPEMVVLFLPGDHLLSAALERNPEILERAIERKVLISTPVTLISVLKGVAYGWRQEQLAANAQELRLLVSEFYDRVRIFSTSFAESSRHLTRAVEAFNKSAASWESRLLPALRRMNELGIGAAGDPPSLPRIGSIPREPAPPDAASIDQQMGHNA